MRSLLLLCALIAGVSAIFEDQLGEADWKVENLGVVRHAIFQDKKIVVATEQGVLALLQQGSGSAIWRTVLPRGDHIDAVVATADRIVALCNGGSLLRSWSLSVGGLQWEASLVKLADPSPALRSRALDLAVDSEAGRVVALQDNCVNYVSLLTGDVQWFWCPSDDHIIVSHLIAPVIDVSVKAPRGYGEAVRAAVACRVHAGADLDFHVDAATLPCGQAFLLTASVPSRRSGSPVMDYAMQQTPLTSSTAFIGKVVPVSMLKSAFAKVTFEKLGDATSFGNHDVLFAGVVEPSSAIYAWALSAPAVEVSETRPVAFSQQDVMSRVVAGAWALRDGAAGTPQPMVSFCVSSPTVNTCDVYTVDSISGSASVTLSCDAGPPSAGNAVAAVDRDASHSWGSVRGVGCSTISYSKQGGAAKVATTAIRAGSNSALTITTEVPQNKFGQNLVRSLQASFIQLFTSKADGKQAVRGLYVGGGVGSLFLVQGSRSVWSREEALAHLKQALIIPRPQGGRSGLSSGRADTMSKAALTFSSRLRMQYAELQRLWSQTCRWVSLEGRLMVLHILDAESRRAALFRLTESIGIKMSFLVAHPPTAQKSENSALRELEKTAQRESRDRFGKQFGFDKIAIILSHNGVTSGSDSIGADFHTLSAATFLKSAAQRTSGVKLLALDLIHGDVLWNAEPNFDLLVNHIARRRLSSNVSDDRVQMFIKLLPGSTHRDDNYDESIGGIPLSVGIGASIFVASVRFIATDFAGSVSDDVLTCMWHVDVYSGDIYGSDASSNGPTVCLPTGPGAIVGASLVDRSGAAQMLHSAEEVLDLTSVNRVIGGTYTHLLLRHDDLTVAAYPSSLSQAPPNAGVPQYVHAIQSESGVLMTYSLLREGQRVHPTGCSEITKGKAVSCPEHVTYSLSPVGSALTRTAPGDQIVAMAYPTAHDKITSRAYVLGDNSLLLKYLNPNIVVVVSESFERIINVAVNDSGMDGLDSNEDGGATHLVVSVIDTVSGRVIYRYEIAHGGPAPLGMEKDAHRVCAEIIEHAIIVTYWNFKAQRMELSSLMLYEGMITKTGLGPMTSFQSPAFVDVSSFSAPQPIGLQKTFILPKTVVALGHTLTLKGLTNKHLLLGLKNGQVYRLDLRQVDPRRPLTAPTQSEKDEGLMQYNPFVTLIPQSAVTNNDTVARLIGLESSPSMALESTSLVLVYGLDVFFTRVSPSKDFDMLSSEFNRSLLTLILGSMSVIVIFLRKMHKDKVIKTAWK